MTHHYLYDPKLTFLYTVLILLLLASSNSELCSSICATDFCVPIYGIHTPIFNAPVYSISPTVSLFYPSQMFFKLESDPNGIPTMSCTGENNCNQICTANSSLCSGDTNFCSNRTCSMSSSCYCTISNAAFHSYLEYNGTQQLIIGTTTAVVESCETQESLNQKRGLLQSNVTVTFSSCEIYTLEENGILKLTLLPPAEDGYYKVYYLGETKILPASLNSLVALPIQWTQTTGDITIEYMSSDAYCFITHHIVAKMHCELTDCVMCSEAWNNYKCLPPSHQNVVFWSTFLIICLIIFVAPFAGYVLWIILQILYSVLICCFKYGRKFHHTRAMKSVYNGMSTKANHLKFYLESDVNCGDVEACHNPNTIVIENNNPVNNNSNYDSPLTNIQESSDEFVSNNNSSTQNSVNNNIKYRKKVVGYKGGRPIYNLVPISIILILCFCSKANAACSQGASVGSTQTQCVVNGTLQTCTEVYNVLATIPTLGAQYCFSLQSNGSAVWSGFIQHLGLTATLSLTHLYYTSAWTGFSQSSHWCDGTSHCSGGCSGIQSSRTAGGSLSDGRLNTYPGTTICHSSCGCVTCDGCFLCSPSCLYSGYGIIPNGNVYDVFSVNSITYTPTVLVSISGPGLNIQQTVVPTANAVSIGNFTVQLIGSFTPPQISLSSLSVIRQVNTQNYYFATAATLNQITSGIPGDIQASTTTGLTGVPASFKIGSIVTSSQGDLGDTYIFPQSGVSSTFSTWSKIPTTIGGNVWTLASGVVSTNTSNPPSLAISLQTPNGLKFVRTVNVVCPIFTVVNASGCFSCDAGSVITISARSSCSAGAVSVSLSDLSIIALTPGITISTSNTQYIIAINTNHAQNSFDLILTSSFSSYRQSLSFTAVPFDRVVNNNDTSTNDTVLHNGAGGLSEDFINFSSSIGGIITWVIVAIVIAVAVFLLFPFLVKLIMNCLAPPKRV